MSRRRSAITLPLVAVVLGLASGCSPTESTGPSSTIAVNQQQDVGCHSDRTPAQARAWALRCPGDAWSSPLSIDLNDDGVDDIVSGAHDSSPNEAVVAIDGVSGDLLWRVEVGAAVITIPRVATIDSTGRKAIVVGTRATPQGTAAVAGLVAFDALTGAVAWRAHSSALSLQNVYTPEAVGDLTGDGISDWLFSTGGDPDRPPSQAPTIAGQLGLVDGRTGRIFASVSLPRPEETYSPPLFIENEENTAQSLVVLGSGGELFSGSIWTIHLSDLVSQNQRGFLELGGSRQLDTSYIAPMVYAGESRYHGPLVVAASMDGRVTAFDPTTGTTLWQTMPVDSESIRPGFEVGSWAAPALVESTNEPSPRGLVVVSNSISSIENVIAGQGYIGDIVVSALDLSSGSIESQLLVRNGDSISSPLLIRDVQGRLGVVCVCIDSQELVDPDRPLWRHASRFGVWRVGDGHIDDMGVPASSAGTPVLTRANGAVRMTVGSDDLSVGGYRWSLRSSSMAVQSRVSRIVWGGYLPDA